MFKFHYFCFIGPDVGRLAIHTDSNYIIDSVTNWIYTWLTNGWRKRDGSPLKNKKQYRDLLLAMEGMDIDWVRMSLLLKILFTATKLTFHPSSIRST